MSIISVNHLCRDVARDRALREALLRDPEGELAQYPRKFTATERAALLAGDVGTLYQMGVNAYLMGYLARGLFCPSAGERSRQEPLVGHIVPGSPGQKNHTVSLSSA